MLRLRERPCISVAAFIVFYVFLCCISSPDVFDFTPSLSAAILLVELCILMVISSFLACFFSSSSPSCSLREIGEIDVHPVNTPVVVHDFVRIPKGEAAALTARVAMTVDGLFAVFGESILTVMHDRPIIVNKFITMGRELIKIALCVGPDITPVHSDVVISVICGLLMMHSS